ncbi:hypothetical protein [Halapricum desulfuricans]|uniref:Glycosyl hydrolases family 32 (Levanase/invertase) n=1 Tax=Halapricum desulfuricans TaxID=2841257 RepID=A0A897MYC8_9EURY|nr:hypothetical protein [Halapricum desulfuricans]QSG04998.1 Glycosyl hydrolases family 32 (levanase/invertase) [Halapricum desulfuricans]
MIELTRRRLLEAGTAATALSVAGCLQSPESGPNTGWFPAGRGRRTMAYLDFGLTQSVSDVDPTIPLFLPSETEGGPTEFVPRLPSADELSDPLVRFPLEAGGQVIAVGILQLAATGLGDLVDPERSGRGITDLFVVDETVIGAGDIDVGRAAESLRSGTDGAFGEVRFTSTGDHDGYTLYESDLEDSVVVALGEDAVVAAGTAADVRTVLETRAGENDRLAATHDTAGWLFDTAGLGNLSVGWINAIDLEEYYWDDQSVSRAAETLGEHEHALATLSFAPERDEVTADIAIADPDFEASVTDRIESRFGSAAVEASTSVDGDRLTVTGTYTDDAIDVEFDERGRTETPAAPSGEDVPEPVREAVEGGEFTFEHQPENSLVRVNFEGDIDADEVTIRARPSGLESSMSPADSIRYLNVMVESDDREVIVIVTVDDSSGVVARTTLDEQ